MTTPEPDPDPDESSGILPPEDVPPVSAEELVDGTAVADDERRYPSTIGGAFYLLVLVLTGVGLAIIVFGDWRLGVRWMSGALALGAVVRVLLPARDAGMLAVRHKLLDAALLTGLAAALFFLAGSIPDQPGL